MSGYFILHPGKRYHCHICKGSGVNDEGEYICDRCWRVGLRSHFTRSERRNLKGLFKKLESLGVERTRPDYFAAIQDLLIRNHVNVPDRTGGYTFKQLVGIATIVSAICTFLTLIVTLSIG